MKLTAFLAFVFLTFNSLSQNQTLRDITLGCFYSLNLKPAIVHNSLNLSFSKGHHSVFVGPEYNTLRTVLLGDPITHFEKNNWGLHFGYQYTLKEFSSRLNLFGQFSFSIFEVKYTDVKNYFRSNILYVENNIGIGLQYSPIDNIQLLTSIGFGSYQGFFLMLESFSPNLKVGLRFLFLRK